MHECFLGCLVSRTKIVTLDWYCGKEEWGLSLMFSFNLICFFSLVEPWSVMANMLLLSLPWLLLLSRAFAGEISDAGIVKGSGSHIRRITRYSQCAEALWNLGVSRERMKAPLPGMPPPTTPIAPRTMSGAQERMPETGWQTTTSSVGSASWGSMCATPTRSVLQEGAVRSRSLISSANKEQTGRT